MEEGKGRVWFALTALAVFAGVVIQLFVTGSLKSGFFDTSAARTLNVLVFFTIQSNLIVGVTSMLLALNPRRSSTGFNALRLTGIVTITITGVVYHAVLSKLFDLESWALVADNLLHTVVPILAVVVWLALGPRGRTSPTIVQLSVLFPVAWLIFTLVRGAFVHFYPYPFVDVGHLGYPKVIVKCVWVAVLYLGVAAGAAAIDRRLARSDPLATAPS